MSKEEIDKLKKILSEKLSKVEVEDVLEKLENKENDESPSSRYYQTCFSFY